MSSRSLFRSHQVSLVALILLSVAGVSAALADEESDPPGRVARLSYANGSVSLQPAGVEDWTDATVNRPLTTGDKLWADQNSRAELDIGSAVVRLGSMTGLSFLNLDDRNAQLNVTAGTAIVHVRSLESDQSFEIDTPNVAVTLQSPGDYRVEVNEAGDGTVVKISNGDAQVSATGQSVPMHTQQAFAFNGTDQVSVDPMSVGAPDALDSWSLERDRRSEQAQARTSEYVPPEVAGADDLADYGTWETTPEYGPVWTPNVAVGWSPYHFGRWVWISPWGWTWVDDAPWGFAPFHYGRWAYRDTRWCWVPGPRHLRPIYAPALVAWVGSPGASVSITVGGGPGVGWFPLGPREVYVPGYRVSHNYVRNVNVTNTTIINNTYITNVYENKVTNVTYVNRNRPGAVVAVSQDVFTSARPISGHTMRIPENQMTRFTAHGVGPAITPARESVLGHRPDLPVRRPPPVIANRAVVARTAPPPAPVPFERQQAAIRANGGRPLARSEATALQAPGATNPRVRVLGPGAARPIQNGGTVGRPGQPGTGQQFGTADRPAAGLPGAGQQYGTARPRQPEQSMQDRERSLHATPVQPQSPRGPQPSLRSDRPPDNQMRQNDQYRMQNTDESRRRALEARPTPEARPIEQPRAAPEARPIPQARPIEQPRVVDQDRSREQRAIEQQRSMEQQRAAEQQRAMEQQRELQQQRAADQQRAVEQQRSIPQARPIEQPRPVLRAPEQPRPMQRQPDQPRPQQAPPPQQRTDSNRGRVPERDQPR